MDPLLTSTFEIGGGLLLVAMPVFTGRLVPTGSRIWINLTTPGVCRTFLLVIGLFVFMLGISTLIRG